MRIGFVLFEDYFQRKDIGSSRIRGEWVIKYLEGAERFVQGKDYDCVVYQKTYWKEHAKEYKGIKILDICDPDWLDGAEVISFAQYMDAIVVPTERMKNALEIMVDCPVVVIADRIDIDTLPEPKRMTRTDATRAVWFGYIHNSEVVEQCLGVLAKKNVELIMISDGTFNTSECKVRNVRYDVETINDWMLDCDFALLPKLKGNRWEYKSDNKKNLALSLGLPVVETVKEFYDVMDFKVRETACFNANNVRKVNDVRKSAVEWRLLIEGLL